MRSLAILGLLVAFSGCALGYADERRVIGFAMGTGRLASCEKPVDADSGQCSGARGGAEDALP